MTNICNEGSYNNVGTKMHLTRSQKSLELILSWLSTTNGESWGESRTTVSSSRPNNGWKAHSWGEQVELRRHLGRFNKGRLHNPHICVKRDTWKSSFPWGSVEETPSLHADMWSLFLSSMNGVDVSGRMRVHTFWMYVRAYVFSICLMGQFCP